MRIYSLFIKRLIDILVSLIILTIALPVFLLLTIVLFIEYKGSPFFFQLRPGKNEKIFRVIKFKTMNDAKDAAGNLLTDGERLNAVGRWMRRTSLDEIPQLINVIIGDMSLIGPRPLLIRYLPYYNDEERKRHTVRPGITGLAQVKGRNSIHWDERIALDIVYVNNISFFLDCKILFFTVFNVLNGKNIVIDPGSELIDLDVLRKNK
jgi:undecaprenyl phosphate N,N'-diacetylbacillosamine 1-phosphate transferase